MKLHMITEEVIENIFKRLETESSVFLVPNKCQYYSYNKNIKEPEKIIKLENYVEYMYTIRNILIDRGPLNYCSCRRYVQKCIDIHI